MKDKKFAHIINNRIYDINTAIKLYSNGKESLYRKKIGELFLYNEDEGVKLLTEKQAQEYVSKNLPDQYDKIFVNTETKMVSLILNMDVYEKLCEYAKKEKVSMQFVMREAVFDYLEKHDK